MNTSLLIRGGLVLRDGALHEEDLLIREGRIAAGPTADGEARTIDARGLVVLPGLIDIHTHGAAGIDVNAADYDGFAAMSRFMATQGTTGFLCSILTDTPEQTKWCIRQALRAQKEGLPGAKLLGIHLEGPFLSPDYKGAMPERLLRKGDAGLFRRYQQVAEGTIRYMTVSPEIEGVPGMISEIRDEVVIAIGHSGATYAQAMDAIERGARSSTHTFNAMRAIDRHEPAILGAALESGIFCEAICDGLHLHPGVVRLMLKCKGYDRVVAVTDSIMAAGLPDGQYKLGVNDVVVRNGDARLAHADVRAGSTLTQQRGLQNLMRFTGEPVERVAALMSENPARLIGFSTKGRIADDMDGDLTIVTPQGEVVTTVVGGEIVFTARA